MSPIWVTKQTAAPNIDPGTYALELTGVRQVDVEDFDNPLEKAARIELTFVVRGDPRWEGASFTDLCTPRMGPKSKLGQVVAALYGGAAPPDGEVDLEAFVGRRLHATIRRKDNGFNQIIAETAVPLEPADLHDA